MKRHITSLAINNEMVFQQISKLLILNVDKDMEERGSPYSQQKQSGELIQRMVWQHIIKRNVMSICPITSDFNLITRLRWFMVFLSKIYNLNIIIRKHQAYLTVGPWQSERASLAPPLTLECTFCPLFPQQELFKGLNLQ